MVREMAEGMVDSDKLAEMEKEIAAKRPEMVAKCTAAVDADPELEAPIDCMIAAPDAKAMMECEGADKLGNAL